MNAASPTRSKIFARWWTVACAMLVRPGGCSTPCFLKQRSDCARLLCADFYPLCEFVAPGAIRQFFPHVFIGIFPMPGGTLLDPTGDLQFQCPANSTAVGRRAAVGTKRGGSSAAEFGLVPAGFSIHGKSGMMGGRGLTGRAAFGASAPAGMGRVGALSGPGRRVAKPRAGFRRKPRVRLRPRCPPAK
jgi:hypothetical protein